MYVSVRTVRCMALLCSLAVVPLSGCGSDAAKGPVKAEHFEGDGHDHKEGELDHKEEKHDHKEGEQDHK